MPVIGVAFEMQARVRGDNTKPGETSFGLFRDTKMATCPGNDKCGHGYICSYYAKSGTVEIGVSDGAAGHKNLASAKVTKTDSAWHHVVCKRRFDGAWEIIFDGKRLPLTDNTADLRFTSLPHVST